MKWQRMFFLGLGVLCLLMSIIPTNAKAQTDEGFLFPYAGVAGVNYYITQNCHSDGWGAYYTGGNTVTCAIDFTKYGDGRDTSCGEPGMAPVSGEFTNLGTDLQGNTLGFLKGIRYWILWFHGDFVPSGYLNQGNIFGYEGDNGYSSACHWHMDVYDTFTKQWVDPTNPSALQTVSTLPLGAGIDITADPNDALIAVLQNITINVSSTIIYEDVVQPTATAVIAPTLTVVSPITTPTLSDPIDRDQVFDDFIKTWGIAIGLILSLGMIAFSGEDKGTRWTGAIILLVVIMFGIRFYNQGFQPRFKLSEQSPSTQVAPSIATDPPAAEVVIPPAMERQVEEVVVTNVSLPGLPTISTTGEVTAAASPPRTPPTGDCAINSRWPDSIQKWCTGITEYSFTNGASPDRIAAMMWQETLGNPDALSSSCAVGLIQVMPSDGKGFILTNSAGQQYFKCDLVNGTLEAYQSYYSNVFRNRPTIAQIQSDPYFGLEWGVSYYGGLLRGHNNSDWEALYYYGGPGYGDIYRGAVFSHYDCVVNNQAGSCRSDLANRLNK